jgi:hypothetical protein
MNIFAYGQGLKHSVSFPLLNHQITNHKLFSHSVNKRYLNGFYLPNLRYDITYKNYSLGFESYYYDKNVQSSTLNFGIIENYLKLNTFSLLTGYTLLNKYKLSTKLGTGITYHHSWIISSFYTISFEGYGCYEKSKFAPMLWASFDYNISKKFFSRLNIRYNQMLKKYNNNGCLEINEKERFNYLIGQLALGYKF